MNAFKRAIITALGRLLPERIKISMFHLTYHLAHAEFEKFAHHYAFAPSMHYGLTAMAQRGFCPKTIIDAGAYEGDWSRLVKRIWPSCRLVMVEPNAANSERLLKTVKDVDAHLLCELLGAEDGREVPFNVMASGSSIMNERSPLPRKVEVRRLRTLDSIVKDIEPPALLKIDAQGYELQILMGASRTLADVEAVLLEIAIIEINEGAPLLHEVVAFMKANGFVAYDILEIHRRPLDGALNQVDIVFVREQSRLIADKRHFAAVEGASCG